MATRKISEIIEDLRTAVKDDNMTISDLQKNTEERASELEAILAKEKSDAKFMAVIGFLAILFSVAVAIITSMSNDDLREDVTQKKEIITKYEESVRHDTVYKYRDQNGNEITIPSLLEDNLNLMKKINDLEYQNSLNELKLQSIESQYGIKVVGDKNLFHLEANRVDSALRLLPVFRDRVKYDSVKGQWSVTRRTVQIGDKSYPE